MTMFWPRGPLVGKAIGSARIAPSGSGRTPFQNSLTRLLGNKQWNNSSNFTGACMTSPSRNAVTPAPALSPVTRQVLQKPQSIGLGLSGTPNSGQYPEQNSHSMGPRGCIATPHLRPLCTFHTCAVNAWGGKSDDYILDGILLRGSAPASNDSSNSDEVEYGQLQVQRGINSTPLPLNVGPYSKSKTFSQPLERIHGLGPAIQVPAPPSL